MRLFPPLCLPDNPVDDRDQRGANGNYCVVIASRGAGIVGQTSATDLPDHVLMMATTAPSVEHVIYVVHDVLF